MTISDLIHIKHKLTLTSEQAPRCWGTRLTRFKCIVLSLTAVLVLSPVIFRASQDGTSKVPQAVTMLEPLANMTGDLSFNKIHYKHLQRRLPQCVVIGVRKGGTRALIAFLKMHPDIVATGEEVHFFDRDENYAKGLEWYRSRMPYSLPGQITMEKTPAYFHDARSAERLHRMNSSLRLLLIVRDPVVRAVSDWYQLDLKRQKNGRDSIPFEKLALRRDGSINTSYDVLQRSVYASAYKRWTKIFSPRQIHVVHGEAFMKDPSQGLEKIEQFLKIPRYLTPDLFFLNETKGFYCALDRSKGVEKCLNDDKGRIHPYVDPRVLQTLRHYYKKFNERFFRATEQRFDWEYEPRNARVRDRH